MVGVSKIVFIKYIYFAYINSRKLLRIEFCIFWKRMSCSSPVSCYFPKPKLWAIIWKREKIISYRTNLIMSNQFHEKNREIKFTLKVVFIKLISGKKFVKSILHSILPNMATFPKWIMGTHFSKLLPESKWHIGFHNRRFSQP